MLACVTHFFIVLFLNDGKGIMCSSHEVFADPSTLSHSASSAIICYKLCRRKGLGVAGGGK